MALVAPLELFYLVVMLSNNLCWTAPIFAAQVNHGHPSSDCQ